MDQFLSQLTIGALAREANVSVETIRFYQRKKLLSEPDRCYGSIRRYGAKEVSRVRFIKSAQRIGFTLEEVAHLLQLEDGTHCSQARQIAEQKLTGVRQRLVDLHRMETALDDLVRRCGADRGQVICPLIASLQQTV